MKVAVWIEDNWAFGRIAQALKKYGNVDIYDWRDCEKTNALLGPGEKWKEYDKIISTSYIFKYIFPEEFYKKLVVSVHFPVFDHPHFIEILQVKKDVTYWGVCKQVCDTMIESGYENVYWSPFGADIDLLPVKYPPGRKIRRIGLVGSCEDPAHQYSLNKGYELFEDVCKIGGFEPVYVRHKTADCMFDGIDILICCSKLEGGPLGIFEAAASGLPVLTTKVGNVQEIEGVATFTTAQEAVDQINYWNTNPEELRNYTLRVTLEVRTNWNMEKLIKRHLGTLIDFIEIGSTDFEKTDGLVGYSIQPVQKYIGNYKGVTAIRAAISDQDGFANVFSVLEESLYKFPYWARGCNSLGDIHPKIMTYIRENNIEALIYVEQVETMTFETLCKRYNINGCKYLKINTEGHDIKILESYIEFVKSGGFKINKIKFESNDLTPPQDVDAILAKLAGIGYSVVERGNNTILDLNNRINNRI
jgi:Methyltransferase FkbM domain